MIVKIKSECPVLPGDEHIRGKQGDLIENDPHNISTTHVSVVVEDKKYFIPKGFIEY